MIKIGGFLNSGIAISRSLKSTLLEVFTHICYDFRITHNQCRLTIPYGYMAVLPLD